MKQNYSALCSLFIPSKNAEARLQEQLSLGYTQIYNICAS